MRDVLDVVLAVLNPLSRGQNGVEDVLLVGFVFHWGQCSLLLERSYTLAVRAFQNLNK